MHYNLLPIVPRPLVSNNAELLLPCYSTASFSPCSFSITRFFIYSDSNNILQDSIVSTTTKLAPNHFCFPDIDHITPFLSAIMLPSYLFVSTITTNIKSACYAEFIKLLTSNVKSMFFILFEYLKTRIHSF